MRGCGQPGQQEQEEELAAGSHLAPGGRARGQHAPGQWGARGMPSHPGRDVAAAQPALRTGAAWMGASRHTTTPPTQGQPLLSVPAASCPSPAQPAPQSEVSPVGSSITTQGRDSSLMGSPALGAAPSAPQGHSTACLCPMPCSWAGTDLETPHPAGKGRAACRMAGTAQGFPTFCPVLCKGEDRTPPAQDAEPPSFPEGHAQTGAARLHNAGSVHILTV